MTIKPEPAPADRVDVPPPPRGRHTLPPIVRGVAVFLVFSAVVGGIAGLVWHAVATPPAYTVGKDGVATTTEEQLGQWFSIDAWYSGLAVVGGALLGLIAWWLFRRLGWLVPLLALVAGQVAGFAAWGTGAALGPRHFAERLAAAASGDTVPIDFTLRSHVAVLLWSLFAVLPVLLYSALGRDEDDPIAAAANRTAGGRMLHRLAGTELQRRPDPAPDDPDDEDLTTW